MPSPKAILRDIADLGLDPTVSYVRIGNSMEYSPRLVHKHVPVQHVQAVSEPVASKPEVTVSDKEEVVKKVEPVQPEVHVEALKSTDENSSDRDEVKPQVDEVKLPEVPTEQASDVSVAPPVAKKGRFGKKVVATPAAPVVTDADKPDVS